jgi:glucose/mannose-6-phosphate isomerase
MELMRKLITEFPQQLKDAWKITQSTPLDLKGFIPQNVVILGMGGSGISGVVASKMLSSTAKMPIAANSDYRIPAYVNESTLIIACSYSGGTEETLTALSEAMERGAQVVAITSGGQLAERAAQHAWPMVRIPGGQPPRSQFGYAFTCVMHVLHAVGAVPESMYLNFEQAGPNLEASQEDVVERASQVADVIENRTVWLYADAAQEGLITRWRQQLNENSKMLVTHHVFPEMNHNELVGWESGSEADVAVMVQCPEDHPRTLARMEVCTGVFQDQGADVVVIEPSGDTELDRFFDLVHLGDWLSLLLAERSGVDPVDIRYIDLLKSELAKIPQ